MRVVQASAFHYPRGGDCVQFLDIAGSLESRGHEVARFCMHHPDNLPSEWSDYWLPYIEYRGELTAAAKLRAAATSLYRPEAARQMRRLLRDFSPDVVHFHSVHHHLTMAAVDACFEYGVPVVWTLHDYRTVCPATSLPRGDEVCERCAEGRFWHCVLGRCKSGEVSRSLAAAIESYVTRVRGCLAKVACYIAPSRFLARTVKEMGLPARRIEVVPNPVVCGNEPAMGSRAAGELLYVGRLSREKGVETLVRAVSVLPDVRLRVVGDGPDMHALRALADATGADVAFDGWLNAEGVRGRMRETTLLCVPSIWYENCPGVVLEAMTLGLPVVASSIGGLTELLDAGRTGWLAPPGDVTAWSGVLRSALAQPERSARLARAALARVRERHDPTRFIERIEELYRSVAPEA